MYEKPISYSGLSLYKRCPLAWKHAYIDGNRGTPGKAAMRGTKLHEKLENYFNGDMWDDKDLTLLPWKAYMYDLSTYAPLPEEKLAVDFEWQPLDFDDGGAHLRGAVDLSYIIDHKFHVKDWKSGQIYASHEGQADMYACLGLATYPECKSVEVEMVYLDHPRQTRKWEYSKDEVRELRGYIDEDVATLRLDEEYLPTPSQDGCKWCPLSWRNGGACDKSP